MWRPRGEYYVKCYDLWMDPAEKAIFEDCREDGYPVKIFEPSSV